MNLMLLFKKCFERSDEADVTDIFVSVAIPKASSNAQRSCAMQLESMAQW